MKQYTAEQIKLSITELTKALLTINDELLNIYSQKEIYDLISEGWSQKKCKNFQTFGNIISGRYNPKREKKELYLDYIEVLSAKIPSQSNAKKFGLSEKGDLFYDVFYCRIDSSENETIGIAKIHIQSDWQSAKLMYFYHSMKAPFVYLEGTIKKYNKNIYINFEDKTEQKLEGLSPENKADASLVLYNIDENVSKVMVGCLTSIHRHKRVPMSSLAVLNLSEVRALDTTDYLSDFKEIKQGEYKREIVNLDERLQYYLIGQQLRPENDIGKIISDIDNLSTNDDFIKIKDFVNSYQYIYFSTNIENKSIRSYRVDISLGGIVKVYTNKGQRGYEIGRARIISKETTPILLVQYDYNSVDRSYKKSLLLTQHEKNYLEGIYFGVTDSALSSGRAIFKVNNEYSSNGVAFLKKKNPITELNRLSQNDEYIRDFFQNDNIALNTDLGLKNLLITQSDSTTINRQIPNSSVFDEICGNYECYFNVKRIEQESNEKDSSTFGQILYLAPLIISKDKIEIKYFEETIVGEIRFDNKRVFLYFLGIDYYISINFRPTKKPNVIYGLITVVSEKNSDVEFESIQSSYVIIERSSLTESEFNQQNFKTYQKLRELIQLEKEKKRGLISKLWGHYNRTLLIREQNSLKVEYKHVRWEAYRRIFWNSACFNAMQYNSTGLDKYLDDAFMDLLRAHRHGFGMKYWADLEYGHPNFPKALSEEYEMILAEYQSPKFFIHEKLWNFLKNRVDFAFELLI